MALPLSDKMPLVRWAATHHLASLIDMSRPTHHHHRPFLSPALSLGTNSISLLARMFRGVRERAHPSRTPLHEIRFAFLFLEMFDLGCLVAYTRRF
jgi:hypothetical protein